MDIITGYTAKKHITSEQDRDINIGIAGENSYVLSTGAQIAAEVSSNNEIKIRDGVIMHQGCAASIKKNTYDLVTILNGSQGMKRIDLIVARYERDRDTNIETLDLHVIQGEPVENNPAVPEHITGDIQGGDLIADMPLYQVTRTGLNITEVKKVFKTLNDLNAIKEQLAELNSKKVEILSKTIEAEISSTGNISLEIDSADYVVVAVKIRGRTAVPYISNAGIWASKVLTTASGATSATGSVTAIVYYYAIQDNYILPFS